MAWTTRRSTTPSPPASRSVVATHSRAGGSPRRPANTIRSMERSLEARLAAVEEELGAADCDGSTSSPRRPRPRPYRRLRLLWRSPNLSRSPPSPRSRRSRSDRSRICSAAGSSPGSAGWRSSSASSSSSSSPSTADGSASRPASRSRSPARRCSSAVGLFLYERRGQTEAAVAAVASALAALYASLTYATAVKGVVAEEAGLLVGRSGRAPSERPSPFAGDRSSWPPWRFSAPSPRRCSSAARRRVSPVAFMVVALVGTVGVLVWQRWGWLALGALLISAPQLASWAWITTTSCSRSPSSRCTGVSSSSPRSATSFGSRPPRYVRPRRRSSC